MQSEFSLPLTGAYPWIDAAYSHVGWVPNVSGHLSFGLIQPQWAQHSINYRSEPTGERTVVVHAQRSAQDFPLPGRLVGALRPSVTQDFLLVGRTATARTPFIAGDQINEREELHGALVGLILVVPRNVDAEANRRRRAFLAEVDEAIEEALAEASSPSAIGPALADHLPDFIVDRVSRVRADIVCHAARFALFRTGELRIWFDETLFAGRDARAQPLSAAERAAADLLPSQMYFFIKDTAHQHYHHDPETDQILKLFRIDTTCGPTDDETWRIDTLRGLAKVVVECRHSDHPTSNKKALGILAYADAFQSLLARIRRGPDADAPTEPLQHVIPYDFNHVRSSIEALDALNETQRGALLQFFGIIVGVVLSAFALWSGAVQIQAPLCDAMKDGATPCPKMEPNTAVDVVNWIVANPLGFVVALTVLGFIAFEVFFKSLSSLRTVRRLKRWFTRFSSAAGTDLSRLLRGSDYIGYVGWLLILASLTAASAYAAYLIVPKHKVPVLGEQGGVHRSGWWQLDNLVGKKPKESGLLTDSVITHDLQDIAGDDYGDFLSLMADSSVLQRSNVLWATGSGTGSANRDAAYLIIDQINRKLEIGLRRNGASKVHRSTGPLLEKPAAIAKAFDGVSADVMPLAIQAAQCGTGTVSDGSRTLIFSGMLPANDHCEYKLQLRRGQVFSYSQASAHGLQLLIGEAGRTVTLIEKSFTADRDTTYIVHLKWEPGGASPSARSRLRPFYLRAHID